MQRGGEGVAGCCTFVLKLVSACAPALREGIVGASDAFPSAWGGLGVVMLGVGVCNARGLVL